MRQEQLECLELALKACQNRIDADMMDITARSGICYFDRSGVVAAYGRQGGGESSGMAGSCMNKDRRTQDGDAMSDAQAVRLVLDGRTEAFAVLVRRHQDYLFNLLRRHLPVSEVPEAAQDAFVKAFEKLSQLREPDSFRAWLSSMALRRAIRYWRDVSGRREVSMDLGGEGEQDWLEAFMGEDARRRHDDFMRRREASSVVSWLLGQLKPDDRMAVGLYYAKEHEVAEIAVMLGWSVEKVKVRLHRARKKMAAIMHDEVGKGRQA
ncbi:MAG: RNA polymerase sigma factor [Acidobacteriota bacterium]